LLQNDGFELSGYPYSTAPLNWNTNLWSPSAQLFHDNTTRHSGFSSAKITAATPNDAWFSQEATIDANAFYLLTGWIKTENVSVGAGANLSLVGTWTHTQGLLGTNNWTRVSLWFNSGSSTRITIGARLGYWAGTSSGTAWFDDLRLTRITPDGPHPRWKILVLIYDKTDAVVTDTAGVRHHMLGAMTSAEIERATLAATQFVQTDIPALTSGNMIPELTIRYPDHALTQLDAFGQAWWPSPANTASDRDPAFDSVIVIWDPRVVDQYTGTGYWIGGGAGLTPPMNTGQTYATIIIEATGYGHRNVFKHEWGHSILFYFDAAGTAPKPTVTNHVNINQYLHWPTGDNYVWVDETDANQIPNSIYNNESGFTHDYYSGTTATADEPTRRLGITPEAWMLGGPVTKPGAPSGPPPVITCSADIVVSKDRRSPCSAPVLVTLPTISDACESDLTPVGTRSDGLPLYGRYPCGQTVITWTATTSENLTSSCQQVVTVTDDEPPVFVQIPPPVSVTTGPGATSCGAVVEDSQLVSTTGGANPVTLDPTGDVRDPSSSLQNDIVSSKATFDRGSLTFTVTFAEKVFPASSGNERALTGFIEIDTDQNPGTGHRSIVHIAGPQDGSVALNLGVDYRINLTSESWHPGFVEVNDWWVDDSVMGTVPILFTDNSFTFTVPLVMLGGDNGLVNYGMAVGVGFIGTDRLPNGADSAVSVAVSDLIAIDNGAGVTISRIGVPANNLFSVGETLITYTATDVNGNTASVTQTVTVVDNTPPVISQVAASPSILWPPNRDMVDVTVTYEAADNCAILESWLSVSSNQPGDSSISDWEVVDAHHVRLRAARSARWGERLYTVTITAKDIHGNLSTQTATVIVPQSKGQRGTFTVQHAGELLMAASIARPEYCLAPEFLGKLIPPLGETIEEDRRVEKQWVEQISERSVELLQAAAIKVTCVVKGGDKDKT
jgi:hypothetical protein